MSLVESLKKAFNETRNIINTALRDTLDKGILGKISELRDYWKNLPAEEKEIMFFLPLHFFIALNIGMNALKEGIQPIQLISQKPALAMLGITGSVLYKQILTKLLEHSSY